MRRIGLVTVALTAVFAAVAPQLRAQDESDTSTAARIDRLEQRILVSERLREIYMDSVRTAEAAKPVIAAGNSGFSIRSADNAFSIRFRGYLHSDGRYFFSDSLKPGTNQFLMRRVRPILEATVFKIYDVRIMPDFGNGQTVLQDAYVEARFAPGFRVRSGKFKPPVGQERLQSATEMFFVERGLPTNLVPNRDIGVQVSGDLFKGVVSYAVGAMNGVADLGVGDGDINDDKDAIGRIFLQPFRNKTGALLSGLGFGVAGSYGTTVGTPTTTGAQLAGYRTSGQNTFFSWRNNNAATGTTIANGRHTRFSPQGFFYAGRFGVFGEYVQSKHRVTLNTTTDDIPVKAWQVGGNLVLFGGTASFRGIAPRKAFDPSHGGWGALEFVARYGRLTVDDAAFPIYADSTSSAREARGLGLGVNWYLNRNVKLVTSFERTRFKGGAATGDRETEKVLFSRVQFNF
jgi:phosphate-selective porin OprO/OprP